MQNLSPWNVNMGLHFKCAFELFGLLHIIQGREYQRWTNYLLNFCPQASTVPMKEWIFVLGLASLAINTVNWYNKRPLKILNVAANSHTLHFLTWSLRSWFCACTVSSVWSHQQPSGNTAREHFAPKTWDKRNSVQPRIPCTWSVKMSPQQRPNKIPMAKCHDFATVKTHNILRQLMKIICRWSPIQRIILRGTPGSCAKCSAA